MRCLFALIASVTLLGCSGQTPECATYIACQTAIDDRLGQALQESYGANGDCWSSTADVAKICTETCKVGVTNLAARSPNTAACK